jgi:hypothetical protein
MYLHTARYKYNVKVIKIQLQEMIFENSHIFSIFETSHIFSRNEVLVAASIARCRRYLCSQLSFLAVRYVPVQAKE